MNPENPYELKPSTMLPLILKWKKLLITVTGVAFVISILVSFLIEEKYESTVVLFPASTTNISKTLLAERGFDNKSLLEFGEEEQAEQLLQILNSDVIRNRIIEKYDLLTHYGIDQVQDYKMTKLYEEYESNISFKRTPYMSVEISVLDKNAELAANIANDIAALVDTAIAKMRKKVAQQALLIVEQEYHAFQEEMDQMNDEMNVIRSKGVQDYYTQVEVLSEQYAIAMQKNNTRAMSAMKNQLDTLAKYGGAYQTMTLDMEYKLKQLNLLKTKYQEAKVEANASVEHKFIVNKAFKAERPSYPIKWLIVLFSTFSAFLFTLILITLFDLK
jgi:uncharacterized protein involved in exopolysaccharide biosynthesis